MDLLAVATFVLAGITGASVVVIAVDGRRARSHQSAERRRERQYDRLQNAYAKLRVAAVLAQQMHAAMKLWPLAIMALPASCRVSAAFFPKHADRLRDMEAALAYTRFWSSPPWQHRSDQLVEAIVDATGWIRPLSGQLNQTNLRALDAAGNMLATMMDRVQLPWTAQRLVNGYLEALKPVLDELERQLNQQIAEGGRDRRSRKRESRS